jgi:hypothetical protein
LPKDGFFLCLFGKQAKVLVTHKSLLVYLVINKVKCNVVGQNSNRLRGSFFFDLEKLEENGGRGKGTTAHHLVNPEFIPLSFPCYGTTNLHNTFSHLF